MNIKIIHTKNLRWLDIINPSEEEMNYLRSNFNFQELDYADVFGVSEHPKIETRENYNFLVMLFPVYDRKLAEIRPAEIDIFVAKNFLITIHDGTMYTMTNLIGSVDRDAEVRQEYMGKGSGFLLYKMLESLFRRSFPILDHINKDMTGIEKNIFRYSDLRMLEKISLMKRNIIDFRRIMKTHHLILKKLMGAKESHLVFAESKNYYANVLEHAENIWDILAIQKETIEALQDANQSLATNQLNQITKRFTIFSGIFFPATFILLIFGLNTHNLPFAASPNGFWIILCIAMIASLCTVWYFKHNKWF